jgi:hypothetical protein
MDWARVKEVFGAVLEADEATRADTLERACAGDAELRTQVRSLLGAHGQGGVFDEPSGPECVGPFELGRELGRGAFGVVRLGVQRQPVSREVAVKLLHAASNARGVLARFRAEQETLAHLDHTGIARLIECGSDERGRPWFAMELARGERITRACEQLKLGVRERIAVMVQVCRAVQHAHQRGVIHRDLKPSNIIVSADETGAVSAKVIDFGIAKALSTGAGAMNPMMTLTREHQLIGTPAYMSPEQAAGGAVETTSDVYALGAVLFELLTGKPPVDAGELSRAAPGELAQVIRASSPGRVSSLAQARDAREKRLLRELDWVVIGALRANASERIASAGELGDELSAVLEGRPTRSGPPGAHVRVREVVRRHPLGAALVTGAAILLVGVTAGSITGLVRARQQEAIAQQQAKRADQTRVFLLEDMLLKVAQAREDGRDTTVPELLDAASANLDERFADNPQLKLEVLQGLMKGYARVGAVERFCDLAIKAYELAQRLEPPDYRSQVEAGTAAADAYARLGNHAKQMELVERLGKLAREKLSPDDPAALQAEAGVAIFGSVRGDAEGARAKLESVASRAKNIAGGETARKMALTYLCTLADMHGRYDLGVEYSQERLEVVDVPDASLTELADAYATLVRHLIGAQQPARALELCERAEQRLGGGRASLGLASILSNHSALARARGERELTLSLAERAYAMAMSLPGAREDRSVPIVQSLAWALDANGEPARALEVFLRCRDASESNLGVSAKPVRWSGMHAARLSVRAGDTERARGLISRALVGVPRARAEEIARGLTELITLESDGAADQLIERAMGLAREMADDAQTTGDARRAVIEFAADMCLSAGRPERANACRELIRASFRSERAEREDAR